GGSLARLGALARREHRVYAADAFVDRWMRGEQRGEARAAAKEHVAGLFGARVPHGRTGVGDARESAGDALRIARELDGRGVGEELALARHAGLDQLAEQQA